MSRALRVFAGRQRQLRTRRVVVGAPRDLEGNVGHRASGSTPAAGNGWRKLFSPEPPVVPRRAAHATPSRIALNRMLARARGAEDVLRVWGDHRERFDVVHLTTATCRVSADFRSTAWTAGAVPADARWRSLVQHMLPFLATVPANDLSALALAFSRAGENAALKEALSFALDRLAEFSPVELSRLGLALEERAYWPEEAKGLTGRLLEQLDGLDPPHLVSVVSSLSRAPWTSSLDVSRLGEQVRTRLPFLSGRELSRIAQSLAWRDWGESVLPEVRDLADAVARAISDTLENVDDICMVRMSWALAKLEVRPLPLLGLPSGPRDGFLARQPAGALARVAWSLAKADDCATRAWLPALIASIASRAPTMTAPDVSMCCWALLRMDVWDAASYAPLASRAAHVTAGFSQEGLGIVAAALASVSQGEHVELISALADRAAHLLIGGSTDGTGKLNPNTTGQLLSDWQTALLSAGLQHKGMEEQLVAGAKIVYAHKLHAGGASDCFKHVLLSALVARMSEQASTPLAYIDTHAGAGLYSSIEGWGHPRSSGSAGVGHPASGIQLLQDELGGWSGAVPRSVRDFSASVSQCSEIAGCVAYPGSPALGLHHLREGDSAVLIEAAPTVADDLRRNIARIRGSVKCTNICVEHADALQALRTAVGGDSPSNRGLVFVDPPYESSFADSQALEMMRVVRRRWPKGDSPIALWYPILRRAATDRFYTRVRNAALGPVLVAEISVPAAPSPGGYVSASPPTMRAGVFVLCPPCGLEQDWRGSLPLVCAALSNGGSVLVTSKLFWL